MSLAKYRKIFKNGAEVDYPIYKTKDQQDGSKEEETNSLPEEDQVSNG